MQDPNDDRSNSMNPNNDAYQDSQDNHADQLNPNNDEYRGSADDYCTDDENGSQLWAEQLERKVKLAKIGDTNLIIWCR